LGVGYYSYERDQALRAENAALKQTLKKADLVVQTLLKNTHSYVYDFFGMGYMGNAQEFVDRDILIYGAYEKYVLFLMKDLAKNLHDNHLVFYDIGAYTGQHSLFMSKYAAVVHAFEPYPPVAARFRHMIEINKIKNITLWPIALGKEQGSLPMEVPPAWNPAIGSLTKNWHNDDQGAEITVEVKRGDELPSEVTSDVDLIKLDTEGYEKNIVIGLRETLKRKRPIVIMELNIGNDERWVSEEDVYKHFPPDYKLLWIKQVNPPAEGRYRLEELRPYFSIPRVSNTEPPPPNILLFPSEKQDKIPLHDPN